MTVSPGLFYRERPRCPFWIYLAFFLIPTCFFGVCLLVIRIVSGSKGDYWSTAVFLLVLALFIGLLPAASQRLVTVDGSTLRLGRNEVLVAEITDMRAVSGQALAQARHEIANVDGAGVWGVGPVSTSLSMISAGISLIRTEDRRRGMFCSPWQETALLVETPAIRTRRWLIAARDPGTLQRAIEAARLQGAAAPADV